MTQGLNRIAIQFRSLLLDYGLIGVSVTQANDRTQHSGQEPPIWLGLGDVDSSRTGLPAQADLMLETDDFAWITRELHALARRHAAGRVVSMLEGGYDRQGLADGASAHVRRLMGKGASSL